MNLHALRIFHNIVQTGSVTRAAKAMNISQPAVTAQIRNLECELDAVLFRPNGRGVLLTEIGEKLSLEADRLFSLEKEIETNFCNYKMGLTAQLKVVTTYLPAYVFLPEWVALYKQKFVSTEVGLSTTNSKSALNQLLNYRAEIAFLGGDPEEQSGVDVEQLFHDELWFVVPKHHKLAGQHVSLAEMMKEPFILREEGSSTRQRLFSLCDAYNAKPPLIAMQFNGMHETIRASLSGHGAMFIYSLAIKEHIDRGDLARVYVDDINLKIPFVLCVRRGESLSLAAQNFVDLVKEHVH